MNEQEPTFYDSHPFDWTEGYSRAELERTLAPPLASFIQDIPVGALVLDAGCGPGRVMSTLAARGAHAIGVDLSSTSVHCMVERTRQPGAVANCMRLPFSDESADRIIADGVVHHTLSPFEAFSELCRVLKNGGLFYLAVYKPGGHYQKLYAFPGAAIRRLLHHKIGKALIHTTLLPVYFVAHFAKSSGRRSWSGARNLFYDYFATPIAEFISRAEVETWCMKCGVHLAEYSENPGLNIHSFVIKKVPFAATAKASGHLPQSRRR